ncbi:MAG TPA: thiamine pyrophosphate-dependent enzyme, partial [Candidatus Deferrimicrobium sp.]
GELLPEIIERLLSRFSGLPVPGGALSAQEGGRRPTLCPGCAHRSSFYAIRKAVPAGIYPSDIGCYTLGINLGAVDTVLCMGAAVSQAAGFDYAHRLSGKQVDIVATIGDSTFYHAGIPPLIDAVVQGARFVLVILDNGTTAMTGNQPTPGTGIGAGGETTAAVDMEGLVRACGVRFCRAANPDRLPEFIALLKEALVHARERGVAVVIARQPCAMVTRAAGGKEQGAIVITGECTGCRHCVDRYECPALVFDEAANRVRIDEMTCTGCGVCVHVCPVGAIRPESAEENRP